MAMLETALQLSIDVIGNTIVSAGDIIELKIPNTGAYKSTSGEKLDVLYNGNFLIKNLRHEFDIGNNRHYMFMNVIKDSMDKRLVAPTDNIEPKSEILPKTISENWDEFET